MELQTIPAWIAYFLIVGVPSIVLVWGAGVLTLKHSTLAKNGAARQRFIELQKRFLGGRVLLKRIPVPFYNTALVYTLKSLALLMLVVWLAMLVRILLHR